MTQRLPEELLRHEAARLERALGGLAALRRPRPLAPPDPVSPRPAPRDPRRGPTVGEFFDSFVWE